MLEDWTACLLVLRIDASAHVPALTYKMQAAACVSEVFMAGAFPGNLPFGS